MADYTLQYAGAQIDDALGRAFSVDGYNILDNADFTDPINQRKITTLTNPLNGQYTIDRWQIVGNGGISFSVNPGYITLINSSVENKTFRQILEPWRIPAGKSITLSIQTLNGGIYSASAVTPAEPVGRTVINIAIGSLALFRLVYDATNSLYYVPLVVLPGQTINVVQTKLEIGSKSTLGIGPTESHAQRLTRCQYYFERIAATAANMSLSVGHASTASLALFPVTSSPKRTVPTVTPASNLRYGTGGLGNTPTGCTVAAYSAETGHLQVNVNGTFTANSVYRLGVYAGAYIDIQADL